MNQDELTLDQILAEIEKHEDELDFSDLRGLTRLAAIELMKKPQCEKILTLNLSNNRLNMIDEVHKLFQLQHLNASYNIIEKVKLKNASLLTLNLSFNRLKIFPDCSQLVQLKVLDISNNFILTLQENEIKQLSKSLSDLYINNNKIKFTHGVEITRIIKELKQIRLTKLNIYDNPFLKKYNKQIEICFVKELFPPLKSLNNKSAELMVPEPEFRTEDYLANMQNLDNEEEESENSYAKQLAEKIQKCVNDPQSIVDSLNQIDNTIAKIVVQPKIVDQFFQDKDPKRQKQIADYIELFLQNCFIFAQNQQTYAEQILKALAQLAIVRYLEIGRRCFQMVVEIVRTGTDLVEVAKNIILKYSIPLLQQETNLDKVPTFVMEGILRTIEERQDETMVPLKLAQINFVEWLDQILNAYTNDTDNLRDEQQQRDVLFLQFVAQLATFELFSKEYHDREIITKSMMLFKLLIQTDLDEQYIGVLYIINNSMKKSIKCTQDVLNSRQTACNFIKDVEDEVTKYFFMFKKFRNSLINPETKENKDKILLRYEKFGILIQIYGTIWKNDTIKLSQIRDSKLIDELLQLATIPSIHPYLVNASAVFIRKLLKNKVITKTEVGVDNNDIVKYICNKTQNCELLLNYLGGDYYPLMMKELDPTIQKVTKNLSTLVNTRIHEVFRNIIKLIKFFSKNALSQDSPIADICTEVSKNLDDNGRDQALFIVLATPNDVVRLTVVQCLLTIKVSQLDTKEVGKLVNLLGSYRNLGAGKTESVVANIMMILTKIVVGESSQSRDEFVTVYSQNATLYALDVLERNQERDLTNLDENDSEQQEKVELSFGTTNFLKSLHCDHQLRENLKGLNQAQIMKSSLLNEDKFMTPSMLDIDIERSFIGKQCSYLISVLFNKDALLPYSKVSDRILIRIAENLEMRPEDTVEDLSKGKQSGFYDFHEIQTNWKKIAEDRRIKQTEIWDTMHTGVDPEINYVWDIRESAGKKQTQKQNEMSEELYYHISQHQLLYNQEGAINLLGFLLGRNSSAKSLFLKEYFLQTFGIQLNFEKQINSILYFIREQIHNHQENYNKEKNIKMLSTTRMNQKLGIIFSGQPMPTDPLRGFIKQKPFFNPNKIIHFPLFSKKALSITQEQVLFQQIPYEQRTVTVCSYLRIVYALLVYCPKEGNINKRKQLMAEQLGQRPDYIRELTLICQWADWHNGNIAAKYLKIINVILEFSLIAKEKLFMTSFFVIAKAIREMLDIISVKLQNEDKFPLTYDDLVLIKETCECMSKIADNLSKVSYEDKILENFEKDFPDEVAKLQQEDRNLIVFEINRSVEEYILSILLPLQGFTIFVEIIVWDMQSEQHLKTNVTMDEKQFRVKFSARQSLIKVVSQYIVKCKSQKLQILTILTKMEVFYKKFIRQSFLQEVLEDLYTFDYQNKLQESLLLRQILFKKTSEDTQKGQKPDHYIQHYFRCFYQNKKGANISAIIVLTQSNFIVCEIEEVVKKLKNKSQLDIENKNLNLEFKVLKQLFQIPKTQIGGFYKMESEQRVCLVYSLVDQPYPFRDEDSLEIAIFFFLKLNSFLKLQVAMFDKIVSDDTISQCALLHISNQIQPKCIIWGVINPEKPIQDKFNEFHKKRLLIVNDGQKIKLFTENMDDWFFLTPDMMLEHTINNKYHKLTDQQKKQACEQAYFRNQSTYDLDKLSAINIDQTLHNQLELNFGSSTQLRILFGCDRSREIFKYQLLKSIDVNKFKKIEKNIKL